MWGKNRTTHNHSTVYNMYIPDECSVVLGEVEGTLESEVIQGRPECLYGALGHGLERLVENGSVFTLQQPQKANLTWIDRVLKQGCPCNNNKQIGTPKCINFVCTHNVPLNPTPPYIACLQTL